LREPRVDCPAVRPYNRSAMRKLFPIVVLAGVALLLSGCVRQEVPAGDIVTTPYPPEGPRPLEVEFDASGFGEIGIVEYQWDFGDEDATASGRVATYTFKERGTYQVQVTVLDERNRTATAQTEVQVRRKPPVAKLGSIPRTVAPERVIEFDAGESYHPDDGQIVEYQWDFGDGTVTTTSGPTETHAYRSTGARVTQTFHIQLRVKDDDGNISDPYRERVEVLPDCCGR